MQQINLYSQLDHVVTPPLAAIHQLWILAVGLLLAVLVYTLMWFGNGSRTEELRTLQHRGQASTAQLQLLQAKKQSLLNDDSLDNSITHLQQEVLFRRQVLASVNVDQHLPASFAAHLSGLARQHIEGMWFTQVLLQRGGRDLALKGRSQRPEYLPQYLQKLSAEAVFAGHQFRVFRMTTPPERRDLLDFELRALSEESPRE